MRRLAHATIIKRIASEEFGAADDDEDQSEGEHESAEETRNPPRQAFGAGHDDRHEESAERDESAGEQAEHDESDFIACRLRGAGGLAGERHFRREQRFDRRTRDGGGDMIVHGYAPLQ